jgi:hypothetical protein
MVTIHDPLLAYCLGAAIIHTGEAKDEILKPNANYKPGPSAKDKCIHSYGLAYVLVADHISRTDEGRLKEELYGAHEVVEHYYTSDNIRCTYRILAFKIRSNAVRLS